MSRRLSIGLLLLSATTTAQAQHPDTLAPRPVTLQLPAADSLRPAIAGPNVFVCSVPGVAIEPYFFPSFTTVQPVLSRVAGVQVTPYSGAPGAWSAVRIRGVAHVTGYSQPLYVVDDVPVYNNDISPETWQRSADFFSPPPSTGIMGSFVTPPPGGNPLLDLPVADIESVEVLKGAAATARYGRQGGHGVIRIKTRRGADGQDGPQSLRVRYTGFGGVQQLRQRYALLDAAEFVALRDQGLLNSGGSPNTAALLQDRGFVDWQDRLFRPAAMHGHNLSLDGHTGATRYYVAADYLGQGGVLIDSRLRRSSLRANVDQRLGQRLTLSLKVAGSQLDQREPGVATGMLVQQALLTAPLGTLIDAQGRPNYLDPEQWARRSTRAPRMRRLLAQLSATYQLAPGFSLSARGSYEAATARDRQVVPPLVLSGYNSSLTLTETSDTEVDSWVTDVALDYRRTFGTRHALTGSVSYLRQQAKQYWASRQVTEDNTGSFGRGEQWYEYRVDGNSMRSPSAAVGYTYDGRYELQACVRTDQAFWNGQNRLLWYPGAQLSWHLGREAFLADLPGLSALSLYAGAGRTAGSFFTPVRLVYPFGLESTDQLDAGLETAWLQRRLTVSFAAYQRYTRHAQAELSVLVPSPGGTTTMLTLPDVDLRNRGLELTVGSSWRLGPLVGSSSVAAALNRTRVEEIANMEYRGGFGSPPVRVPAESIPGFNLQVGKPLAYYQVYEPLGFYPAGAQQGGVRYRDVNQDGWLTTADTQPYGSGLPRYTLNVFQSLQYKRLQLELQLDGLFGYQIHNPTLMTLDLPRTGPLRNYSARTLAYSSPDNSQIPAPANNLNNYQLSRDMLADGSHLRLTQLQLSYAVLQKDRRRVSVWVGGQNLLVTGSYRGFDPNVAGAGTSPLAAGYDSGNYPVARIWQLGVRGQF